MSAGNLDFMPIVINPQPGRVVVVVDGVLHDRPLTGQQAINLARQFLDVAAEMMAGAK
jgi:hypothetical protein